MSSAGVVSRGGLLTALRAFVQRPARLHLFLIDRKPHIDDTFGDYLVAAAAAAR